MVKTNVNRQLYILIIILLIAGCTASSRMVSVKDLDTDLNIYSSIVISVESYVAEDVTKEITDLEMLVAEKVNEIGLFQNIILADTTDAPENTLLVRLAITQIKKVSSGKRFMLGAFAGRATMTTDILFLDLASGKKLGSYLVTGESGGTGISGDTSDAVKKAAEGVTELISQNFGR